MDIYNIVMGKTLEIGGGNNPVFHPNMDIQNLPTVDIVHNLEQFPYPVESNSFDNIYSAYLIEHITWRNVKRFISELYRILKPNGKVVLLTANLLEQCRKTVEEGVNEKTVEMIFGSQEFPLHAGCHKNGFSPEYAEKLFTQTGFNVKVTTPMPSIFYRNQILYPSSKTDMLIEATKTVDKTFQPKVKVFGGKKRETPSEAMNKNPHPFNREYFNSDCQSRGYIYEGYRDFFTHYKTAEIVYDYCKKHNCKKVLEVGAGRGYVSKILKTKGLDVTCLDISEHCLHTRVVEDFILWDITKTPWNFKDKKFDCLFSVAVLEHIHEDKVDNVIREMARISKCGIHGINFTSSDYDVDDTHATVKQIDYWQRKFEENCPSDYTYKLMDKEKMEAPPYPIPSPDGLVKLNLGCFTNMFYYGWRNYDIVNLSEFAKRNGYIFEQLDVRKGLPYDSSSVDLIFSSHLIEHLDENEVIKLLKDCHRVLKPGGVLRIATPDACKLMRDYINGVIREYRHINKGVEKAETDIEALLHLLFAGHKTVFDEEKLFQIIKETNFTDVEKTSPFSSRNKVMMNQTFVSHPTISLVVEAVK